MDPLVKAAWAAHRQLYMRALSKGLADWLAPTLLQQFVELKKSGEQNKTVEQKLGVSELKRRRLARLAVKRGLLPRGRRGGSRR